MTKREEIFESLLFRKFRIYIYAYFIHIYRRRDWREREKKTEAELNKTKGSKRDGRPREGCAGVCATMSERGLFKEATCVRETRELVCRLPTDKSVARAFFNCVPPTPAPCPPPFNSPLPLTPSTWPHYFSLSSFFLFLFFFFVLSESVLSEYRSTYPKDVGVSRNRAGSTDSRSSKGKKKKEKM